MQDAYLLWVCYAVLFFLATFCALALPLYGGGAVAHVAAEGVWQVVFVVFLAYAMMPLKAWVAALFGLLLSSAHIVVSVLFAKDFPHLLWQQVNDIINFYSDIQHSTWEINNSTARSFQTE